jgi:hypothetical protein
MEGVVSEIFMIGQFIHANNNLQLEVRKVENACKERIVRVKNAQQFNGNDSH